LHIACRGFFVQLFTTSLKEFTFSHHIRDSKRYLILFFLRFLAAFLGCLFTVPSVVLSVMGQSDLHKYPPNEDFAYPKLTKFSLEVFYALVIANAVVGSFADYIYHAGVLFFAGFGGALIVATGYYDAVVSKGICAGILEANALSVFEFAYPFQSMDYLRRVHAMVVLEQSQDLIRYLFYTREGMEYTSLALGSDDPYKQLAAANIVGLWVEIEDPTLDCRRLRLHTDLLPKLADKLGSRLVGRAAAYSFYFLGIKHPDLVVNVQSLIHGKNVVDILLDLIFIDNPMFSSCYVRALIPLFDILGRRRWNTSDSKRHEKVALEERLSMLVQQPGLRVCQRVTVAYALFKLCGNKLNNKVKQYLERLSLVQDDVDEFWRKREKKWLEDMLGANIPEGAYDPHKLLENNAVAPYRYI
jgi:hypothetical protein